MIRITLSHSCLEGCQWVGKDLVRTMEKVAGDKPFVPPELHCVDTGALITVTLVDTEVEFAKWCQEKLND